MKINRYFIARLLAVVVIELLLLLTIKEIRDPVFPVFWAKITLFTGSIFLILYIIFNIKYLI